MIDCCFAREEDGVLTAFEHHDHMTLLTERNAGRGFYITGKPSICKGAFMRTRRASLSWRGPAPPG